MKITNRRKFIRTITILLGLIILFIICANKTYSKGNIKYQEIKIYRGDTLWSISKNESLDNKYFQNKDIRYIVSEIKKINNLSNSDLKEGDIIKIPVYE